MEKQMINSAQKVEEHRLRTERAAKINQQAKLVQYLDQ